MVAVIYGVVLGFVVIIVWGKYDDASHIVQREQNAAADLFRLAKALPSPQRHELRTAIELYARVIVEEEWPAMQYRGLSLECFRQSERISKIVISTIPRSSAESNVHAAALQALSTFLMRAVSDSAHAWAWSAASCGGPCSSACSRWWDSPSSSAPRIRSRKSA